MIKTDGIPVNRQFNFIYQNNKNNLKDTAILYFGKKISYKTLFEQVSRVEKTLLYNGIKKGDSVPVCMQALPKTYYLVLALNKIGANAFLVNPILSESVLI